MFLYCISKSLSDKDMTKKRWRVLVLGISLYSGIYLTLVQNQDKMINYVFNFVMGFDIAVSLVTVKFYSPCIILTSLLFIRYGII